MSEQKTPKELIESEEFESALTEGAECKKGILTTYKQQNKQNYVRFQEFMHESNPEIKALSEKRKKDRTDEENQKLKDYKTYVAQLYRQTTELIVKEEVEDGKKTKVEKIVDKIVPVVEMLQFIDNNVLEAELNKRGVSLKIVPLEQKIPTLANESKKNILKDIFAVSKQIKEKVNSDELKIETDIYTSKVPFALQYDKQSNNAGLKAGDFKKLVDMKTKLVMAESDEAKEKVEDKIENLASEKQFECARAELVRDSLSKMK